jgi:hypothetical protein
VDPPAFVSRDVVGNSAIAAHSKENIFWQWNDKQQWFASILSSFHKTLMCTLTPPRLRPHTTPTRYDKVEYSVGLIVEHDDTRRLTAKVNEKAFAKRVFRDGGDSTAFNEKWKYSDPQRKGGYHDTSGSKTVKRNGFTLWTLDTQKRAAIGTVAPSGIRKRFDLSAEGSIAHHYAAVFDLLAKAAVPLTSVILVFNTPRWMRTPDFHLKCFIEPEEYFTHFAKWEELPPSQIDMLARESQDRADRNLYDVRFQGDSYAQNARNVLLSNPVAIDVNVEVGGGDVGGAPAPSLGGRGGGRGGDGRGAARGRSGGDMAVVMAVGKAEGSGRGASRNSGRAGGWGGQQAEGGRRDGDHGRGRGRSDVYSRGGRGGHGGEGGGEYIRGSRRVDRDDRENPRSGGGGGW